MGHLSREEFRLLYLNRSKHLIAEEVIFRGTVDESTIYTREVIESALRKKASALIFAHNHPTAPAKSSLEDIELTKSLVKACRAVVITVLDHVIGGKGDFFSLRQEWPEILTGENMMWPTTAKFSSATSETTGRACWRRASTRFASAGVSKAETFRAWTAGRSFFLRFGSACECPRRIMAAMTHKEWRVWCVIYCRCPWPCWVPLVGRRSGTVPLLPRAMSVFAVVCS